MIFMTFYDLFLTDEELNKWTRVRLVVGFARANISVLIQLISGQDWMFKSFNSRQLQLAFCLVRFSWSVPCFLCFVETDLRSVPSLPSKEEVVLDVWSWPGEVDIAVSNQNFLKYQQNGLLNGRVIGYVWDTPSFTVHPERHWHVCKGGHCAKVKALWLRRHFINISWRISWARSVHVTN